MKVMGSSGVGRVIRRGFEMQRGAISRGGFVAALGGVLDVCVCVCI